MRPSSECVHNHHDTECKHKCDDTVSPPHAGNVKQVKSSANTVEPKPDNGKPEALTFGWSDLRDAFSSWLPSGMVQLNKRFASMEQHADHVVVCFADGTSVAARVVVGADGCFSKVRRQNLQDGIPQYQVDPCCQHLLSVRRRPGLRA